MNARARPPRRARAHPCSCFFGPGACNLHIDWGMRQRCGGLQPRRGLSACPVPPTSSDMHGRTRERVCSKSARPRRRRACEVMGSVESRCSRPRIASLEVAVSASRAVSAGSAGSRPCWRVCRRASSKLSRRREQASIFSQTVGRRFRRMSPHPTCAQFLPSWCWWCGRLLRLGRASLVWRVLRMDRREFASTDIVFSAGASRQVSAMSARRGHFLRIGHQERSGVVRCVEGRGAHESRLGHWRSAGAERVVGRGREVGRAPQRGRGAERRAGARAVLRGMACAFVNLGLVRGLRCSSARLEGRRCLAF